MGEKISYRIMKTAEWKDAVVYQAACDCGSKECGLTLSIERDEEIPNMISLTIYGNIKWSCYWEDNWWTGLKKRVSGVLKMLFTGYIDMNEELVIHGKEHIDSFIQALQEAREKLTK